MGRTPTSLKVRRSGSVHAPLPCRSRYFPGGSSCSEIPLCPRYTSEPDRAECAERPRGSAPARQLHQSCRERIRTGRSSEDLAPPEIVPKKSQQSNRKDRHSQGTDDRHDTKSTLLQSIGPVYNTRHNSSAHL